MSTKRKASGTKKASERLYVSRCVFGKGVTVSRREKPTPKGAWRIARAVIRYNLEMQTAYDAIIDSYPGSHDLSEVDRAAVEDFMYRVFSSARSLEITAEGLSEMQREYAASRSRKKHLRCLTKPGYFTRIHDLVLGSEGIIESAKQAEVLIVRPNPRYAPHHDFKEERTLRERMVRVGGTQISPNEYYVPYAKLPMAEISDKVNEMLGEKFR